MSAEISYYNTKDEKELKINITAYLIDYSIVYPSFFILDVNFSMDEAKQRIPIFLGVGKLRRVRIVNHVVASIHDYKRYLENEKE